MEVPSHLESSLRDVVLEIGHDDYFLEPPENEIKKSQREPRLQRSAMKEVLIQDSDQ